MRKIKAPSITAILQERGKRYGLFVNHANISQDLKRVMKQHATACGTELDDDMIEALEMIQHKIARIINGDPTYSDSWRDIGGYASLVADRLDGVMR